ncbi:TraR/DksA C4-type zinc finger protein [Bacillus sp. DJP31]|uniref:TraR/DksA C4-type zinc finger protein n=1 Tax=Bacillus sp. DJP31 TaxID=3409789 RepID=UPI003BB77B67
MNNDFTELYSELLLIKMELESSLLKGKENFSQELANEPLFQSTPNEKKIMIQKHIQDDLVDVNHALYKIEFGFYGICEDTGERIPIDKLKTIPTARSIHDFRYKELVRI